MKESYEARQRKGDKDSAGQVPSPERLRDIKVSPNTSKEVQVDIQTTANLLSQNSTAVKCVIIKSEIQESGFLLFKSKLLIFKINTKLYSKLDKRINLVVRRLESDFYLLRSILALSFGQCFIPPLTPTAKESNFDKASVSRRAKTFTRFLRGVVRSP